MKFVHVIGLLALAYLLGLGSGMVLQRRGCSGGGEPGDSTVTVTPTPALPPGPGPPVAAEMTPVPDSTAGRAEIERLEATVAQFQDREEGLRQALSEAESTIVQLSTPRRADILLPFQDSTGFYMVLRVDVVYDPACGNITTYPNIDSLVYPVRTVEIVGYEDGGDPWTTDAIQIAGGVLFGAAAVATFIATSK